MDIIIRTLDKNCLDSHIESIIGILSSQPDEYWTEDNFKVPLPGKFDISLVAFVKNDLAGYIIGSIKNQKLAHIHKFMVKEDYRNREIGKKMLLEFENRINSINLGTIELSVFEKNLRAINFYQKSGFITKNLRLDTVSHSMLRVMQKNLT